jgi:hypothetical protein
VMWYHSSFLSEAERLARSVTAAVARKCGVSMELLQCQCDVYSVVLIWCKCCVNVQTEDTGYKREANQHYTSMTS